MFGPANFSFGFYWHQAALVKMFLYIERTCMLPFVYLVDNSRVVP